MRSRLSKIFDLKNAEGGAAEWLGMGRMQCRRYLWNEVSESLIPFASSIYIMGIRSKNNKERAPTRPINFRNYNIVN
jgi:hypothetical protein